jgi:hypothetical protein
MCDVCRVAREEASWERIQLIGGCLCVSSIFADG